jgi:hypothetical protein
MYQAKISSNKTKNVKLEYSGKKGASIWLKLEHSGKKVHRPGFLAKVKVPPNSSLEKTCIKFTREARTIDHHDFS